MAVKYVDDWEFWVTTSTGTLTSTYANSGAVDVSAGKLRFLGQGQGALIANRFTSQPTYIINTRINVSTLGNGDRFGGVGTTPGGITPIANLNEGGSGSGNMQAGLGIRSDGKLQFYRGPNLLAGISATAPQANVDVSYYDIEFKITINNTTGTIEARINGGVEIGPTSGLNTRNTANNFADSVTLCGYQSNDNNNIPNLRSVHFIAMDSTGSGGNDFLGPVDVDLLQPTGDGFYTDWSFTGAATRWQAVDDPDPNEDTDYIFASTVGNKNTFTHPSLPAGTTLVKALAVWARGRRDDAVTRSFKVLLRSSGTDNLGSIEQFLGDSYLWFLQPYEISPFTSTAWTVSEVNALEFGVSVTA